MSAELKTKVSVVHRDEFRNRVEERDGGKARSIQTTKLDKYEKMTEKGYKSLVSGRSAPPSTPMITREDAIAEILNGLTMPDQHVEHTLPYVPDFQREILAVTEGKNMLAVVQRYSALKKVIESHIYEAKKLLKPENMSQVPASLIPDVHAHLAELKNTLADCVRQLELSKLYYSAEIADARAKDEEE